MVNLVWSIDSVVINEIELNPTGNDNDPDVEEWIELYNPTDISIDISGWKISTTQGGETHIFTISQGTVLDAKSYYVFERGSQWLDNNDESVILRNDAGTIVDKTPEISDEENNYLSWQRYPNSEDNWVFRSATKAMSNGMDENPEPEPTPEPTPEPEPEYNGTLIFTPVADTYVSSGSSSLESNYGDNAILFVTFLNISSSTTRDNAYLMFDLSTPYLDSFDVKSASLELFGSSSSKTVDVGVYSCLDTNWNELDITWSNAPAFSSKSLDVIPVGVYEKWYSWDVTEEVKNLQGDLLTLVLKVESGKGSFVTSFDSKEFSIINTPARLVLSDTSEPEPTEPEPTEPESTEPEPPTEDIINVFVNDVIDGDTFDTTEGYRIRLADIDAPELGETGYLEATEYLELLIEDKTVTLDIDSKTGTDPYGRYVCLVYVVYNSTHSLNVNQALVIEGYAKIDDYSNNEFDPTTWLLYYPTETISEFPPFLILPLFVFATLLIVLIKIKKAEKLDSFRFCLSLYFLFIAFS